MLSTMMNLLFFSNELPGDESHTIARRLQSLQKSSRHPYLAEFLKQATTAIQDEIQNLSQPDRSEILHLESMIDLWSYPDLRKGHLEGAIEGVMLAVLELGSLIGHYELHPNDYNLDADSCVLIGLGIGLLAASAVSISPTVAQLPSAGAEAVRCAFRLGIFVAGISQALEVRSLDGPQESCAYVVTGLSEDAVRHELASLNTKIAKPSRLFISAASNRSITVSGPQSRLKSAFRESELLRYSKFAPLPVYGGICHAPHLYTRKHASDIVDTPFTQTLNQTHKPRVSLLSTETGRPLCSNSTTEFLEDVVLDILTRSIRLDDISAGLIKEIKAHTHTDQEISVHAFAAKKSPFLDVENSIRQSFNVAPSLDMFAWTKSGDGPTNPSRSPADEPIAIVGMACRFPGGADDLDSFWDLLKNGLDVHMKVPPDRFDVDSHYDPTGKTTNSSITPFGCFIKNPSLFDAGFFNMSAREALETDPMHRLALVTAYEALERAGFVPNRTASSNVRRVGTFYGQASDDYREVNSAQDIGTYFIPGGCRAFAPGRISYFFGFWGPSFSCDTACSSSLATIQQACTSLWAGDADTIVAGGLNVLTNPDAFAGLGRGHFLSATGNCKTWDATADGYCRADGVGSIVLKRLSDAQKDNDNILGTILASATNHSAEAVSITHPHAGAQAELFTKVLNRSGVDPLDVNYVEFHGTGTQAGDSEEMQSVLNVFAPQFRKRDSSRPLHIGGVKSNVGHGEAAAGVTALIKVLSMLQHDTIPPHVGIKGTMNPVLPKNLAEKYNVHIPRENKSWSEQASGRKRLAVINNFSAAGGNTTLLLEEAPARDSPAFEDERPSQVIALSAKSKPSLKGNLMSMLTYIDNNPDVSLGDLSYTTCARRIHHPFRLAVSVSDREHLRQQLVRLLGSVDTMRPITNRNTPNLAFAFAGQGSIYINAGKELLKTCHEFASEIYRYEELCKLHGFSGFIDIIDGTADNQAVTPIKSSLAIVCIEMALASLWKLLGTLPSIVIGHSLGEFAALHVAGVLSASDTIYLVGKRSELVSKSCEIGSHAMLAVRATEEQIKPHIQGIAVEFACRNSKAENVLAGPKAEIERACDYLQESGYRCHLLEVPFAFHSSQMDSILDEYEQLAASVVFKTPNIPVVSPVRSRVVFDGKTFNARYLRDATRNPVEFVAALEVAQSLQLIDENTAWLDIGAHPICGSFVRNTVPASAKITAASLSRKEQSWSTVASTCATLHSAGVTIDWSQYHKPFATSHRLLDLPRYSWNDKSYWIQYNGTWALTKGNSSGTVDVVPEPESPISTSSVHRVLDHHIQKPWEGSITIESNVVRQDFLDAAWGHKMNDCAVVTSSIHADIAFTIAKFMHEQLGSQGSCDMNIKNLQVLQGLIANSNTSKPQLIQVKGSTDLREASTKLHWYNAGDESHFASATVEYGDSSAWLAEWARLAHLVTGRIEYLEMKQQIGDASKLSRNMAYRLFANLVDYADKYRGMQSVIIRDLEAVADVRLTTETSGTWMVPPHFIDSVCHLAGMIMNGGDASDTRNYFYVTPGWESMRFARPLVPGGQYRSYVKMRPTNPGFWEGDVYILEGDTIIGMVGAMTFRRFPRSLLGTLFSPPDKRKAVLASSPVVKKESTPHPVPAKQIPAPQFPPPNNFLTTNTNDMAQQQQQHHHVSSKSSVPTTHPAILTPSTESPSRQSPVMAYSLPHPPVTIISPSNPQPSIPLTPPNTRSTSTPSDPNSLISRALAIIAREAALDSTDDLDDDASFANLGIDSLLSLVLAEKFREELGVTLTGGTFLDCPTVGAFKTWLGEYC